jgi:hypothetical protein
VVIAIAFLLGSISTGTSAVIAPARLGAPKTVVPALARPGGSVLGPASYFANLHPPPPPPPPPPKPAPPPEPDIATLFRRDVGAILPGPAILVVVSDAGHRTTRVLKVGELYDKGWRISAINRHSATLRRGNEQRLIDFFVSKPQGPSQLVAGK